MFLTEKICPSPLAYCCGLLKRANTEYWHHGDRRASHDFVRQRFFNTFLFVLHLSRFSLFVSLASLLQKLPLNKSPGPDCISAEHLLYADESLRFFLSELFSMCIVHRYIPNSCLNTTIVPIWKNKNGNMSDTSNYRPVAVATVVSKLLEHFILSNILLSLVPQTISLVLRLVIVLINVHFC